MNCGMRERKTQYLNQEVKLKTRMYAEVQRGKTKQENPTVFTELILINTLKKNKENGL